MREFYVFVIFELRFVTKTKTVMIREVYIIFEISNIPGEIVKNLRGAF